MLCVIRRRTTIQGKIQVVHMFLVFDLYAIILRLYRFYLYTSGGKSIVLFFSVYVLRGQIIFLLGTAGIN